MADTMDDAFVPECKPNGDYADVQCFEHEGFSKQCWCVTKDGQEIQGTRTSDGKMPNCNTAAVNKEVKKLEKQHDKPTEHKEETPAPNQTKFEVEVQVIVNDTQKGNAYKSYSFRFSFFFALQHACTSFETSTFGPRLFLIIFYFYFFTENCICCMVGGLAGKGEKWFLQLQCMKMGLYR